MKCTKHPPAIQTYFPEDCFCGAILVDLVKLVVSDGHINISHFNLGQNVVLTEGASICLAASILPGDSLGAEDKHICRANAPTGQHD